MSVLQSSASTRCWPSRATTSTAGCPTCRPRRSRTCSLSLRASSSCPTAARGQCFQGSKLRLPAPIRSTAAASVVRIGNKQTGSGSLAATGRARPMLPPTSPSLHKTYGTKRTKRKENESDKSRQVQWSTKLTTPDRRRACPPLIYGRVQSAFASEIPSRSCMSPINQTPRAAQQTVLTIAQAARQKWPETSTRAPPPLVVPFF